MSWLLCAAVVTAQSPPALPRTPAFDVASVKPNRSGDLAVQIDRPTANRFTAVNVPLRELIRFAYDVPGMRLAGGPDWIGSERFDIAATSEEPLPVWGPSGAPMPLLLRVRALLADRFGLVVHPETRELAVYALVVARDDRKFGPEITASKIDCETQPAP